MPAKGSVKSRRRIVSPPEQPKDFVKFVNDQLGPKKKTDAYEKITGGKEYRPNWQNLASIYNQSRLQLMVGEKKLLKVEPQKPNDNLFLPGSYTSYDHRDYTFYQAPKTEQTTIDLWRAVWQDETCVIVSVSQKGDFAKEPTTRCYPYWPKKEGETLTPALIVESENEEDGAKAVEELKKIIGENLVYYDAKPWLNTVQKWNAFRERKLVSNPNFVKSLDEAMACIDDILDEYSLNQIALSFNGGKDCTVLLHMLRVAIDKRYGPGQKIAGFHIVCDDQFPELTQFIIDAAKMYNIVVMELPGPLIIGVSSLKEQRPQIVPVLMGSRASDPNGKYMKSKVEWTDSDWPRVLRVCPILPWSYQDVWMMLRGLCVHYCQLYDQGYTSLGGRETTVPNEMLRIESSGNIRYCPAYTLNDGNEERKGRKNK